MSKTYITRQLPVTKEPPRIKLTSLQIIDFIDAETELVYNKFRETEIYYKGVFRHILTSVRRKITDGAYYSRNIYYLIAWEILVKVCYRIHGEVKADFPHLVIGVDGQGLLEPLNERTVRAYKMFKKPFE